MKTLIENFSQQINEAIEIGELAIIQNTNEVSNIVISGLGGSGIGGTIVSQLVANEIKVPIIVNKDYFIPAFVSESTLFIASSYSGNTEETLQAMEFAIEKKAQIVCVTSGGKMAELAKENNIKCIIIPGGMPPRAAFAYSSIQLFYILSLYGLISESFEQQLKSTVQLLEREEALLKNEAALIATKIYKKIPIIYSESRFEGISVRFRQQLNENSKVLCWHHALPEMNHNELVGWREKNEQLAVIIFRNENDYFRTRKRMEFSKKVFKQYADTIIEVNSKGNSDIERAYYLIHLGDWISYYLGKKRGMDVTEVNIITSLKGELATV